MPKSAAWIRSTEMPSLCRFGWVSRQCPSSCNFGLANYQKPIKTYENHEFEWDDSIEDLASRPYWRRFWVIQEFLLGKEVRLHCGNTHMDWSDFRDVLGHAAGLPNIWSEDIDYAQAPSGLSAALPLVMGRHPDKHPETAQTLYNLLISFEDSQCKEPRDRVFALLGLVTPDERALLRRFLPDYTMTEDNIVLIALCHVQLDSGGEGVDRMRLLNALGVNSVSRQRRLIKRSQYYDYLGDSPPDPHWNWFDDQEASEFDAGIWEDVISRGNISRYNRIWEEDHSDTQDQGTRRAKRTAYALGAMVFLAIAVKIFQPQVWEACVSFLVRNTATLCEVVGLYNG